MIFPCTQVVQHLKKSQTFIHGIHGPGYVLNIPAAKPIKRRDPHKQPKKATSKNSVGFLYHKGSLHLWNKNSEGINSYRHQFHQQNDQNCWRSQHRLKIRQNSLTLNTWAKNAPIAQANEFIHVFLFSKDHFHLVGCSLSPKIWDFYGRIHWHHGRSVDGAILMYWFLIAQTLWLDTGVPIE